MISCKVIADSIANNSRITTLELVYPRIIHGELLTHRLFSRNSSSSRAVPTARELEKLNKAGIALPEVFYKNCKGMSSSVAMSGLESLLASAIVRGLWCATALTVRGLDALGVHKQHKNRYLEPFNFITTLVTATEWDNFLALRNNEAAQPEMQELARSIRASLGASRPTLLSQGGWHMPYGYDKVTSVARCARVSYLSHDGKENTREADAVLHDRLLADGHMSPFEHCARPLTKAELAVCTRAAMLFDGSPLAGIADSPFMVGNYKGWVSYRRELEAGFSTPVIRNT
jgi:thymidylate synthase ThyX